MNSKWYTRHVCKQNILFISLALSGSIYMNSPVEILKGQNHHFVLAPTQRSAGFTPDHLPRSFSFFLISSLDNSFLIKSMLAEVSIQSSWTITHVKNSSLKREVLCLQTRYTLCTLTSKLTITILLVLDNSIYQNLNYLISSCS